MSFFPLSFSDPLLMIPGMERNAAIIAASLPGLPGACGYAARPMSGLLLLSDL